MGSALHRSGARHRVMGESRMAKCPKLFPIALLPLALALVLPLTPGVSTIARASAEPVATAVIPPPLADPSARAPSASTPAASAPAARKAAKASASPAKPSSAGAAELSKRSARHAALPRNEPAKSAVAQKPSRHAKRERHIVVARAYPPPAPARPRYYYPGAPVADPDNGGPPWPPPWYDRGRPLAGYPYPMPPRGPW
jgi:hypothetical protein